MMPWWAGRATSRARSRRRCGSRSCRWRRMCRGVERGVLAVEPAFDAAADRNIGAGLAVVGAAAAVLGDPAAEFENVSVSDALVVAVSGEIVVEGLDRVGELAQQPVVGGLLPDVRVERAVLHVDHARSQLLPAICAASAKLRPSGVAGYAPSSCSRRPAWGVPRSRVARASSISATCAADTATKRDRRAGRTSSELSVPRESARCRCRGRSRARRRSPARRLCVADHQFRQHLRDGDALEKVPSSKRRSGRGSVPASRCFRTSPAPRSAKSASSGSANGRAADSLRPGRSRPCPRRTCPSASASPG